MDVKQAVQEAKEYIFDLFEGEEIEYVGLEEVEFDHESDEWKVTLGFSRPWDRPKSLSVALRDEPLRRSYKLVRINDSTGKVTSVTDRALATAR
ncbi:MAG: hypothetical protein F4X83_10605 [Chloroflexi bacterium]|nr:hypothetical protein [Chloroflexota bacterium]